MGGAIGDYIYAKYSHYMAGLSYNSFGKHAEYDDNDSISIFKNYKKNFLLKQYQNIEAQQYAKKMQELFNRFSATATDDKDKDFRDETIAAIQKEYLDGTKRLTNTLNIEKVKKGHRILIGDLNKILKKSTIDINKLNEQLNIAAKSFSSLKEHWATNNEDICTKFSNIEELQKKISQQLEQNQVQTESVEELIELYKDINRKATKAFATAPTSTQRGTVAEKFFAAVLQQYYAEVFGTVCDFQAEVSGDLYSKKGISNISFDERYVDFKKLRELTKMESFTNTIGGMSVQSLLSKGFNKKGSQDKSDITITITLEDSSTLHDGLSIKNYSTEKFGFLGRNEGYIHLVSGTPLFTLIQSAKPSQMHNDFINHWINLTSYKPNKNDSTLQVFPSALQKNYIEAHKLMKFFIIIRALVGDLWGLGTGERVPSVRNPANYFVFNDNTHGKIVVKSMGEIINKIDVSNNNFKIDQYPSDRWGPRVPYGKYGTPKERITELLASLYKYKISVEMNSSIIGISVDK